MSKKNPIIDPDLEGLAKRMARRMRQEYRLPLRLLLPSDEVQIREHGPPPIEIEQEVSGRLRETILPAEQVIAAFGVQTRVTAGAMEEARRTTERLERRLTREAFEREYLGKPFVDEERHAGPDYATTVSGYAHDTLTVDELLRLQDMVKADDLDAFSRGLRQQRPASAVSSRPQEQAEQEQEKKQGDDPGMNTRAGHIEL